MRFLTRNIYFIFFLLANFFVIHSVFPVLNYTMVVSTPGFTPLGVGKTTLANFNWFCGDQMVSDPLPIGFTFQYDGTGYTQFEVSDNGQLFLGAPGISCNSNCGPSCTFPNGIEPNNLSSGTDRPAICPLWDDHGFNASGSEVNYITAGVAPNRTLTVEWLLVSWKYNNTAAPQGGISFQVKLFESPAGQIDFIYRQDAQALGVTTQSPSASIGLMGASGDYYSTNNTGSAISKVSQTNITAKPANGVRYRWTQAGGLPIELVSFEGKYSANKTLLEWKTASELNNDYFIVQRSTDAIKFEDLEKLKGSRKNTGALTYNYTDYNPPAENTIIYYRLQQTDFDMAISYSEIVSVNTEKIKAPTIYFDQDNDLLVLTSTQEFDEELRVDIIDPLGRAIFKKDLGLIKGNINVSVFIPLSLKGIYFARLSGKGGNFISQTKFIK